MAIAFDAAGVVTSEKTSSPFTWSHTVGNGDNRFIVVGVIIYKSFSGIPSISAVTCGGVAMTHAKTESSSHDITSIWVLKNPASGANTISVTASNVSYALGASASYTGCDQVSAADAIAGTHGSGTGDKSVTVTTVADNCWCFAVGSRSIGSFAGDPPTALQASRASYTGGTFGYVNIRIEDSNGPKTPAGNVSMGFNIGSDSVTYSISAISFAPVASVAVPIPVMMNQYRRRR